MEEKFLFWEALFVTSQKFQEGNTCSKLVTAAQE